MSTSLLTLFIFIFFITSLASWLYILNEVDPLSKKIKLFLTTLITTCLILTFSSAYTFKKYISERLDTFEVFEKYYPPKGCMNKINVVIGKNGNEGSDGDIVVDYEKQFYKYCVLSPNVTCNFYGDIVFYTEKPYFDCSKRTVKHLERSNIELINTFPYSLLYNLY